MTEEKATFESAHMTVWYRITVNDFFLSLWEYLIQLRSRNDIFRLTYHLLSNLRSSVLINPLGERPMLLWNQSKFCITADKVFNNSFEMVIEWHIIQKDPVIVVLAIEPVLNLFDTVCNFPDIAIASQSDECCLCTRTLGNFRGKVGRALYWALIWVVTFCTVGLILGNIVNVWERCLWIVPGIEDLVEYCNRLYFLHGPSVSCL